MKSIDRRAASGFIHGFRYNIRTLMSLLEERYFQIPLPTITLQPVLEDIATYIIGKIPYQDEEITKECKIAKAQYVK